MTAVHDEGQAQSKLERPINKATCQGDTQYARGGPQRTDGTLAVLQPEQRPVPGAAGRGGGGRPNFLDGVRALVTTTSYAT